MLRRLLKGGLLVLVAVGVTIAGAGTMGWLAGKRPDGLGPMNGALAPVNVNKPNSVSSFATTETHRIDPIRFTGEPAGAFARLRAIVAAQSGATPVTTRPDYLYAEYSTPMLGFVDDVEFLLDAAAGVIHVRSASRLGHTDFGMNRKRVETIREAFGAARASG